jgi:Putative DNA-binding domain
MSSFGRAQAEFAQAVRDPHRPLPDTLAASDGVPPARRFAVYRNNVVVGLVDALRTRFPATERIVGADFFVFMARAFIDVHPPDSPVLMFFGDRLPGFIERFEPASELAYLADVARIECARTHAYHARDAMPSDLSVLLSRPAEMLSAARLQLHPSLAVVRSAFPAHAIWSMNAGEGTQPHEVDLDQAEDTLITRPELDVIVARGVPGAADFIQALGSSTFGDAANQAAGRNDAFDLTGVLAQLIRIGAFAAEA